MKTTHLLFLLVLISLFSSCKKELTRDEIVRTNYEEILKSTLNDAKSYEFVDIEYLDSLTYLKYYTSKLDGKKSHLKYLNENIVENKNRIADLQQKINSHEYYIEDEWAFERDLESELDGLKKNKAEIVNTEKEIVSLDSTMISIKDTINLVKEYDYKITYRAKNGLGALSIYSYRLTVANSGRNYKILKEIEIK